MHIKTSKFPLPLSVWQAECHKEGGKKFTEYFCEKILQEYMQLQDFTKIKKGAAYTWSLSKINLFFK